MSAIKILIFEDNEAYQKIFAGLAKKLGFEITAFCKNSKELLDQMKLKPVQAVLVDLVVPEEDSLALIKKIRRLYPEIPVIVCSSLTEDAVVSKALKAGCYDYIFKPFKEKEFVKSIKNATA